jgi:hypothetical protein
MPSDNLLSIAKLLLPEVLTTYFKLTKYDVKAEEIHFYFKEIHLISDEFKGQKLHSKGFFPEATVQDFPIRGKNVYLHIMRRRWIDEFTSKVVTRDWNLVLKGTRITSDFANFLKQISQ